MGTDQLAEALERQAQPSEARTVLDLIERQKPELARLIPDAIGVERFTRTVLTELRRTPKLLDCDPHSLLGALMLAAQLELEPGPLGHVYLVPFKRQVEFIIGYKGYVDLAYRSGQVKDVMAANVHEADVFEYRYGTRPFLDHTPARGERGDIALSYAVARLRTGGTVFVVTDETDWERARKASASGSKGLGPWQDDRPAMIRKTSVRRLAPFLPDTPALARAVERDEAPAPPAFESDVLGAIEPPEES